MCIEEYVLNTHLKIKHELKDIEEKKDTRKIITYPNVVKYTKIHFEYDKIHL